MFTHPPMHLEAHPTTTVGKVCWWCIHPPHLGSSLKSMSDLCRDNIGKKCVGVFCSFECCLAFMTRWQFDDNTVSSLLASFHDEHKAILQKAPDPFLLSFPYGGPLSIEAFRATAHSITNVPIQNSTFAFSHYVETMMLPFHEKRIYLERIMKPS